MPIGFHICSWYPLTYRRVYFSAILAPRCFVSKATTKLGRLLSYRLCVRPFHPRLLPLPPYRKRLPSLTARTYLDRTFWYFVIIPFDPSHVHLGRFYSSFNFSFLLTCYHPWEAPGPKVTDEVFLLYPPHTIDQTDTWLNRTLRDGCSCAFRSHLDVVLIYRHLERVLLSGEGDWSMVACGCVQM